MPTNDTIISIPFVGGVNQSADPDQIQAPELFLADNVVARYGGRLEKRAGYHLVETAAQTGVPAAAFGGSSSVVSADVEAIGDYHGKDGARALVAAGSRLYEYVGSDATHGWRDVNKLPSYLGTVYPVTATGGSIIEVDIIESGNGVFRLAVWVTGQRSGQEMTNDTWYTEQVSGDGNAVYYSVQLVSTGAFVTPPKLLKMSDSGKPIYNLRVVKLYTSATVYTVGVAYQTGVSYSINFHVIDFATGTATVAAPFGSSVHACYRTFDVVGLPYSVVGGPAIVWTSDGADTASSATHAAMYAELDSVNVATGALTFVDAKSNIVGGSTALFKPWAHRGVVFEQDPTSGTVSFAARVLSRYYSPPHTPTAMLDGQIVMGRLLLTATTLSVEPNQTYIPYIGLQTSDNTSSVLAVPTNPGHYSGQPTDIVRGVMDIDTALAIGVAPLPPTSGSITPMVITMNLADGTTQVYVPQIGQTADYQSPTTTRKMKTLASAQPYLATECAQLSLSNTWVRNVHTYPQNQKIAALYVNRNQITQIDLTTATVNTAFTPGAHTGCSVRVSGNVICTAAIFVNSVGAITEIAIINGNPGYAFANPYTAVSITSITGAGAGTLTNASAYGYLTNALEDMRFNDVPDTADVLFGSSFAQSRGYEMCVHRWSVAASSGYSILALSSTSANVFTTPNGDVPYGAATPHTQNNFFEVYKWDGSTSGALVSAVSTNCLVAALGGPWRVVSGLCVVAGNIFCSISPTGDDYQRSTFLMFVGNVSQSTGITFPNIADTVGSSSFTYENNVGMLVESSNMMRTTSMPMNVPSLRPSLGGLVAGGLRDGSSKGTQEVMTLGYEASPSSWRKTCRLADYTYINGGVLSVFDGTGCSESASLLWPQSDLTSIAWPSIPKVYVVTSQGTSSTQPQYQANAFFGGQGGNGGRGGFLLTNISRPYFGYEAGFNDHNGYGIALGNGWADPIETRWGGDPGNGYESVYTDPRAALLSATGRTAYSFAASASKQNHYYGRYQSYSSGLSGGSPSITYVLGGVGGGSKYVWAPRAKDTWGTIGDCDYKPEEAGGDFLLRWTYESTDGTGRMVRSSPSSAVVYTVCAEIIGAYYDPVNSGSVFHSIAYTGGVVTQFRYGFFAPVLELTNRLKTASSDARRVSLQPYTTAEPYSTVLYRMPFSSFRNPNSDFVAGRNAGRGVVANNSSSFSGMDPFGYVFTNLQCFDGPQKDYNGLLAEPMLYTTGDVLDNVSPPSAKVLCAHQNRLIMGGADDPTVIWMSKELTPTEAPGFNDALTLTISDAGAVTGLASLNGNLVIFKRSAIFVVPGVLPDATGAAPSMGEPIKLPAGVGCIDHRSVLETPIGVFFQSERGLEILSPSLQVDLIGQKITDTLAAFPKVVSAIHYANGQEVRFLLERSDGVSLVIVNYSYLFSIWSTHHINDLGGSQKMGVVNGIPWIAASAPVQWSGPAQAAVYRQSEVSALDILPDLAGPNLNYVKMTVLTAPIDVRQVQGFQRVKRARLLMSAHVRPDLVADLLPGVIMGAVTDYGSGSMLSGVQYVSWTAAQVQTILTTQSRVQVEVHLREQKGQAVQIIYVEGDPATPLAYTDKGWGLAISNVALVVGLKKGLDKRILPDAKR